MREQYSRPPVTGHVPVHPVIWGMLGVMVLLEGLSNLDPGGLAVRLQLWLAFFDFGVHQVPLWDPVQQHIVRISLPSSPVWTVVTYAFLHGGWLHLGMNATVFVALGHWLTRNVGATKMVAIFVLSSIAGAVTFALISPFPGPLVGASGAIFGFLGTFTVWRARLLRRYGQSLGPVFGLIGGLIVMNLFLAFGSGAVGVEGTVAWQAHLGGFLMGALLGALWSPTGPASRPF